ncbi:hypothetical protein [Brevundimonas viscosa]|uniref:hypothetical protein n=1 Tax=Brevundimonas viscosa TaxID=871741 RepID=UPI000B81B0F2|nr:hypothetical protein [Brevundimonas viscosa]
MALPLALLVLSVGGVLLLGPSVIADRPYKAGAILLFFLTLIWIIVAGGPLLISIILGSIWEEEHVWLEGGRLHIGLPFTRRVYLRDICAVEARYAPGDIFGRMLTVSILGGRDVSFVTDVSTEDYEQIKERIETAAQRVAVP